VSATTDVQRLQSFLRSVAANGREVVAVPPFTAYLDPDDALRFLNYAVPDADVEPDDAAIAALRAAFRARGRLPRLEWIEEAAPRVASRLAAAGMRQELRTPLMACAPGALVEAVADVPGLAIATVGAATLRAAADLQRVAFGEPQLSADAAPADPHARGGGGVVATSDGTVVATANHTLVVDGIAEVAGVATAEPWRRRGLAGAVTAAASRAAYAAGATLCVLSPGDEGAQRVYARAGYRRVATILHWSDPDVRA
jgi:ribosomal protein S18 acetylase RimI-like enzyme